MYFKNGFRANFEIESGSLSPSSYNKITVVTKIRQIENIFFLFEKSIID